MSGPLHVPDRLFEVPVDAEERERWSHGLRAMARRLAAARAEHREYMHNATASYSALLRRVADAEHANHRPWRRWRITHRAAAHAYSLGLIASSGAQWNSACGGCLTHVGWRGRRPYVLGQSREWWWCLLRGRHRRREIPEAPYLCAVCTPCWVCGCTDPFHDAMACDEDRAAAVKAARDAARDGGAR